MASNLSRQFFLSRIYIRPYLLLIGAKDFSSEGGKVFCVDFLLTELHYVFSVKLFTVHTALYRGVEKWLQKLEISTLLPLNSGLLA